jgi:hypothetical protein
VIPGISGTLLSHEALQSGAREKLGALLDADGASRARSRIRGWHRTVRDRLGPTASPRAVFDQVAAPLLAQLGYRIVPSHAGADSYAASLEASARPVAALLVTAWGRDPSSAWRTAVRQGIGLGVRWCFCANGPAIRVIDSQRTYSRRFVEFDLQAAIDDPHSFEIVWGLLRAEAMSPRDGPPGIERAIELSDHHRTAVRDSLQEGVHEALLQLAGAFTTMTSRRKQTSSAAGVRGSRAAFDEALIVVYRVLFLLFAEARGLVPRWHPIYRDGYTMEALRDPVELLPRPRGLWQTLQAMTRLAHRGCRIGSLHVPPFNGHLFSPADAPLSDKLPLDDGVVRRAVLALTTRPARGGRVRVAYGDLGVEQLGGVYERLLDFRFEEAEGRPRALTRSPEARRRSGSFYTPRTLTEFLVRRTLAPLVRDASPERILSLRILDPAMGSGAFLVAACRYLGSAYEAALVREGGFVDADITDAERVDFRRIVAQRCLFGVDLNPMAVQLGRLSLWLATLSADRPLTFLDHCLRAGNSLVGARLEDLRRPPAVHRPEKKEHRPLLDDEPIGEAIQHAVTIRLALASEPDDTLEQVRRKERALAELSGAAALMRWKQVADLWCSAWFRDGRPAGSFNAIADALLGRFASLPPRTAAAILAEAQDIAGRERFFHWTLEFPEIFYTGDRTPRPDGGFDAVVGNPPWEMLRGDRGETGERRAARDAGGRLNAFARTSGVYAFQGAGHANLYQLFLERALALLRPDGRIGMILPSGFAVDEGSSELRKAFLERTQLDGLISVENRDAIFPIHRSLKFLLMTGTKGGRSDDVTCRFGIRNLMTLESFPDVGFDGDAVTITRGLLERVGGSGLAVPDLRTRQDVEILAAIALRHPALEEPAGWAVRFGRELNATDDRCHFVETPTARGLLPVVEGKHLSPFVANVADAGLRIPESTAATLLDGPSTFRRARLAYRDVASATNRLSLIAAIIPAGAVTTHTLFCLKTPLDADAQHFLCGIFNSYVANYLVRCRINTHVGAGVIARLAVPKPARDSAAFRAIGRLAASLCSGTHDESAAATLQALVARLYDLTEDQFLHVLETFPLVDRAARAAAASAFCDIVT